MMSSFRLIETTILGAMADLVDLTNNFVNLLEFLAALH
jgi:hypothetical protein